MLLYVDEKGPTITAKTHGGTSWSSTQVKVEKAQKKGLLNVLGAYMIIQIIRCMYNAIKGRQASNLSTL